MPRGITHKLVMGPLTKAAFLKRLRGAVAEGRKL
jgi:hypothetical protein